MHTTAPLPTRTMLCCAMYAYACVMHTLCAPKRYRYRPCRRRSSALLLLLRLLPLLLLPLILRIRHQQAQRFIVEADLEAWVEDQNVQKGINPAPSLLLRQASMLKTSRGVSLPPTRRGERRWMQRWRSRRGLQLRKFPAQERLSVEQMQRKVHHRVDGYEHTCSRFAAPLMRYPAKKEGPFSVGFWCPRIGTEQKMWPENNRFFGIQSQSFVNICPPDGVQGECIVAMEQLLAKPRRTRPPPSAHQHG